MNIAFYRAYAFHHAILDEPYQLCRRDPRHEVRWIEDPAELARARPDIIVYACHVPPEVRRALPSRTLYVFTRHGFASKNYLPQRLMDCDVICLSSASVLRQLRRTYVSPCLEYWVTGFTATDALWRESRKPRVEAGTTLLYAPTWTPSLSAHPLLGVDWMDGWLSRPGRRLIVKPHPNTPERTPDWMAAFERVAARHPDALELIHADANVYELMPRADLLLSDTSSVLFYFLALDRPVVLVDPPKPERGAWDPSGAEWRRRDVGLRVNGPDGLLAALEEALTDPAPFAERRREARDFVYGDLFDGQASRRLSERIQEIADRPETWPTNPRRHRSRTRARVNRVKQWLGGFLS